MHVKVGDIDIFYTIAGVGPTCLVPSLAGTPIYERTFTPALQDVMQQGVFDFVAPPHAWAGELEKLPNATYRVFERSGHYPQLDERELFGEAVAGWLGRGR